MAFKSTTDKVFFFKNFGRSILFFQKSLTIYETPVKTGSITHEWLTNKGARFMRILSAFRGPRQPFVSARTFLSPRP